MDVLSAVVLPKLTLSPDVVVRFVCVLVILPSDVAVSSGVHFIDDPNGFLVVVGFMLLVSCIEVVAGVFNGVSVSGKTDIVSFDVVAVSCLEVSNAVLFEMVVFSIAEVVECVMVVCCLELVVGKIVVVRVVIVAGTAEFSSSVVVSDICLDVVFCLLVCS